MARAGSLSGYPNTLKRGLPAFTFFQDIYPYFKPYQKRFIIAVGALFSVHVVETAIPFCLKIGIDALANDGANVLGPTLSILGLAVLRYLLLNFGRQCLAGVSTDLSYSIRQSLYGKLVALGREFYARHPIGDLMARVSSDVSNIQNFFRFSLFQLLSVTSVVLIAPVFMVQQSFELTLFLVPLLFAMGATAWFLAKRIGRLSELAQGAYGNLTEAVQENLKGIRTIQAHSQEARQVRHIMTVSDHHKALVGELARWNAILSGAMVLTSGLMILILIGIGGHEIQAGVLTIGSLSAFILYLTMVLGVLKSSATPINAFLTAAAAMRRVATVVREQTDINDNEAEVPLPIKGRITIEGVSFRYSSGTESTLALSDISLTIRPGEMLALIGPVGAGKSTLLRLLVRLLDPIAGTIFLDGQDIKKISPKRLRRNISLVMHDSFLFASSMAENISLDDPNRSSEKILAAARAAQLEDTINSLRAGLATQIGERGVTLSGGQRQRVGIARALIRGAPVLLLDDSFSALDAESEMLIVSHLRSLLPRPTIIIATHRPLTAQQADRICAMDKGRVVGVGSHDELVAHNSYYASLVRGQGKQESGDPLI